MISPIDKKNPEDTIAKYLSRLKDGCILLSREMLEDPNFKLTIVLICIYNKDGVFGLVCNRPSHMPLSEVFDVDPVYRTQKRNIYIGGPVQQETLHIIKLTDKATKNAHRVAPNVYLGGDWDSLEAVLSDDIDTTRLFLGYSGWAANQLEMEIRAGAWEVYNIDLEKFLIQWQEPLFQDIEQIRGCLNELSLNVELKK